MAIKIEVPPPEYVITIDHDALVRLAMAVDSANGTPAAEGTRGVCNLFWAMLPEDLRAEVRRAKGYL